MLTYLKIGIVAELICMAGFLVVVLLLRIGIGKDGVEEYLDSFDIGTVMIDAIVTVFIWPAVIPLKIMGMLSDLKH